MTTDPQGQAPASSTLPDFTAQDPAGLPDLHGAGDEDEPDPRGRHRALITLLAVGGSAVVLLAVVALVLSQTVFRSVLEDPEPQAYETGQRSAEGQEEYVPDPEDPDIAPPPPIFTQAPTTDCSVPESEPPVTGDPGTIRGGDLEYTIPDTWDMHWGSGSLPYMTQVDAQARLVEEHWYSVVNLGRVVWPEDEGGYPGLETSAVAIFQCYATTSGVKETFGENPVVTDYRSEATSVDGHPAWIVQATYHFEDDQMLATTTSSVVTSIVVEGPEGPSALASDVAADHEDHAAELEEIIASLKVVG